MFFKSLAETRLRDKRIRIFLQTCPLALLVPATTGVVYEHQCEGGACSQIAVEGFLVPLPTSIDTAPMTSAIDNNRARQRSQEAWLVEIQRAISDVLANSDAAMMVDTIDLDPSRSIVEAFIPVMTFFYGEGWLIYDNSD